MSQMEIHAEVKIRYLASTDLKLIDPELYRISDNEEDAEYYKDKGELSIKSHQGIVVVFSNTYKNNLYPNPENTISCQYRNEYRNPTPLRVYPELLSKEKIDTYKDLLPDIITDEVFGEQFLFEECYVLNKDEVYLYKTSYLNRGKTSLELDILYSFFIIEDNQLKVIPEQDVIEGYRTKLGYWYIFAPDTKILHGKLKNQYAMYDAIGNNLGVIHSLSEGVYENEEDNPYLTNK